jgi:hypothetical protein
MFAKTVRGRYATERVTSVMTPVMLSDVAGGLLYRANRLGIVLHKVIKSQSEIGACGTD